MVGGGVAGGEGGGRGGDGGVGEGEGEGEGEGGGEGEKSELIDHRSANHFVSAALLLWKYLRCSPSFQPDRLIAEEVGMHR